MTVTEFIMEGAHVGRYVAEFCGRPNIRPLDTEKQMVSVMARMVGECLRDEDLNAASSVSAPVPARDPF